MQDNEFEAAHIQFAKHSALLAALLFIAAFLVLAITTRTETDVSIGDWVFVSAVTSSGVTMALVAYWERRLLHRYTKYDMMAGARSKKRR